jgi:hypothetical protein
MTSESRRIDVQKLKRAPYLATNATANGASPSATCALEGGKSFFNPEGIESFSRALAAKSCGIFCLI